MLTTCLLLVSKVFFVFLILILIRNYHCGTTNLIVCIIVLLESVQTTYLGFLLFIAKIIKKMFSHFMFIYMFFLWKNDKDKGTSVFSQISTHFS